MTPEGFLHGIDRRTFLRIVSLTGIAGLVYPRNLISSIAPQELTRVVIIEDSNATSGLSINAATVQAMMNCGIMRLTDRYDIGEAWKSLFPDITTSSVIAIKVNCINSQLSTHPEVASAVAEGLKSMSFGGTPFPENNIIIYDRWSYELDDAGYTRNTSSTGVRCFATDEPGVGYSTEIYDVNGSSQRLSTIATEMADYIVNVGLLKNHTISGTTGCLKNHYGTCNRPDYIHSGHCNPWIPALNTKAPILDKQCVNICDGLFGIYAGGPMGPPQFAANTFIMSQDPVAVDYWIREILVDNGCTTGGISGYIDTAAGAPYNLGTNDPAQMDVVSIVDAAGSDPTEATGKATGFILEQNEPNPFSGRTNIRFYVPRMEHVSLTVFNAEGRRIRSLVDRSMSSGWHTAPWDGRNDRGRRAAAGVYFCQLHGDGYRKSIILQLVD